MAALAAMVMAAGVAGPVAAGTTDSDSDGIPNTWETRYRLNPFSATDAKSDPDKDGLTNLVEYRLHLLPRDSDTDNDGRKDGAEDTDGDRMPNRWEAAQRLNPASAADATADPDHDGLNNVKEYQDKGLPRDEDTDNDGQDDGDEVRTHTRVNGADTDGDGIPDGDEDADGDGVANEDEDDAAESCTADDDDRDGDHVADEDENELGESVTKADSDGDGIPDGLEDGRHDGVENKDRDDSAGDACSGDHDGDGRDDEDEGHTYGTVTSWDDPTHTLVVTEVGGASVSLVVGPDAETKWERAEGLNCPGDQPENATTADLTPGAVIAELEIEHGQVHEIALLRSVCV